MTLSINLGAITHNTQLVAEACHAVGFNAIAMIKRAHALSPLVRAIMDGGVDAFMASNPAAASAVAEVTQRPCGLTGLLAPDFSWADLAACDQSLHVRLHTASRALRNADHFVWLGVLTSDGREGIAPREIPDILNSINSTAAHSQGRIGLLFTWGCLRGAPPVEEVVSVLDFVRAVEAVWGELLPVSFGGSTLLPMLTHFARLSGIRNLRVGEAILNGSVPGWQSVTLGLESPVYLHSRVVDVRRSPSIGKDCHDILITHGETTFDACDATVENATCHLIPSSEACIVRLATPDAKFAVGDTMTLRLGYKSTLRALSNRSTDIQWL